MKCFHILTSRYQVNRNRGYNLIILTFVQLAAGRAVSFEGYDIILGSV